MVNEIVVLSSSITKINNIQTSTIQTSVTVSPSAIIQTEQLSSIGSSINVISSLIDYQTN